MLVDFDSLTVFFIAMFPSLLSFLLTIEIGGGMFVGMYMISLNWCLSVSTGVRAM